MTAPQNNVQTMSPQGLVEHLFNTAFMQNPREARQIATQVVEYLSQALSHAVDSAKLDPASYAKVIELVGRAFFHAIVSAKYDPVAYMTEALISTVVVTSEDDAARREVLKHISGILAHVATQPAASQQPGGPTGNPPTGNPAAGKP
jgi:hypothetical protein